MAETPAPAAPPPYKVELTKKATKQFAGINDPHTKKIAKALRSLECDNPRAHPEVKPLVNRPGEYRLSIGLDWRARFTIDDEARIVLVNKIGPRENFYSD